MSSTATSLTSEFTADAIANARKGSRIAFAAAIAWIVLGVDSIARPRQVNARDTFWMLPFILTMLAFMYLHRVQRGNSRLERVSYHAVMISCWLVLLGNIGIQTEQKSLSALGFPGGAILWTVGLILFGAGTIKAKVVPRYVGWVLIFLEPGSILCGLALSPIAPLLDRGAYSAGIEKGAAVAVLGFALQKLVRASDGSGASSARSAMPA